MEIASIILIVQLHALILLKHIFEATVEEEKPGGGRGFIPNWLRYCDGGAANCCSSACSCGTTASSTNAMTQWS
eukprot:6207845-Pleurochrysis_carterae.AAC.1